MMRCPHCGHTIELDQVPAFDLLAVVARVFGVTVDEIASKERTNILVAARRQYAELARARGLSYASIGRRLNRDHSTIVALLRPRKVAGATDPNSADPA